VQFVDVWPPSLRVSATSSGRGSGPSVWRIRALVAKVPSERPPRADSPLAAAGQLDGCRVSRRRFASASSELATYFLLHM